MKRFNHQRFSDFSYEIVSVAFGHATNIYKNTVTKRKKYYLFGQEVDIIKPVFLFRIYENIESPSLSRSDVFSLLEKEMHQYESLQSRKEEIKNGMLL